MKRRLVTYSGLGLITVTLSALPPTPPQVQQLLHDLPICSILHEQVERGQLGSGTDQRYMQAMRQQGIQRALLEVDSVRQGDKVENPQVTWVLYYDRYDGPDSQITDPNRLNQIRDSGLQATLEELARDRTKKAPFFIGFEGKHAHVKRWYSYVEFFSNPWLPEQKTLVSPAGRPRFPFLIPAVMGDSIDLTRMLKTTHLQKAELDLALFNAAWSRYDNTAVINLLLSAGADINSVDNEGRATPLMTAVDHPCNLHVLLDHGARIDARDRGGMTALKRAQNHKQLESIRILEEAGAKDSTDTKANPLSASDKD